MPPLHLFPPLSTSLSTVLSVPADSGAPSVATSLSIPSWTRSGSVRVASGVLCGIGVALTGFGYSPVEIPVLRDHGDVLLVLEEPGRSSPGAQSGSGPWIIRMPPGPTKRGRDGGRGLEGRNGAGTRRQGSWGSRHGVTRLPDGHHSGHNPTEVPGRVEKWKANEMASFSPSSSVSMSGMASVSRASFMTVFSSPDNRSSGM